MNSICQSTEFGLRAIGVWPDTSYAILRRILCISSMAVFQTFQYQYLFMHFEEEDLYILMDVLSGTVAYSLLLIKLIIFAFNAHLLSEIIAHIVEDWKERDVSEEYTMTRIAYISRRLSNLIIIMYAMTVFLYATSTVLRYKSTNQTDTRELILKMELPFEMKSTSVYIAVLVIQFVHQTSAASTEGVINSLLITLVLHTCGQINIVQQKLSEITQTNIERGITENIMKTLIIRHQKIISFFKNIERIFSNIALVQFVSNILVICCLGFLIVVSISVPNGTTVLVKSVLFYIAINLDAFIFCFVGEYLSTKSRLIGDAAYNSLWYDSNLNQHRNVLLMIMRSQKHLQLTAGKFVDLSLQQFANVLHVCGQIDIVQRKLHEIMGKNIKQNITESIMKKLIIRHQKIILFSKNIEGLFSSIAFIELFSNTLIICCLGFIIVVSIGVPGGTTVLLKSLVFYIMVCLDAFVFCFTGEYLSIKSRMIGNAAYESLWYESNPSLNKNVLLMIVRSQKHLQLTAGKFVDLSLQQFTNIVKASASYVSVLHAMY
ncbi:odorant receptor 22c-like isoform X2 [Camponotus floridanus]|uniref:odorant receptor 22c-like isoform X2 n=1 Tax=Camponotus floridanus TaxID=104421 RepID=UPI000DC6AB9D|nr:odorant receptor 22c-like isoform X2 [Camponotus floridanus]